MHTETKRRTSSHTHTQTHKIIHTNRTPSWYSSQQYPPVGGGGILMVWTETDYWLRGTESPTPDGGNSWTQRREGLLGNQLLAGEQWDDQHRAPSVDHSTESLEERPLPSDLSPQGVLQPLHGVSHALHADFHHNVDHTTFCQPKQRVPISWSFVKWKKVKSKEPTSQEWQYLCRACKQRSYTGCGRRATIYTLAVIYTFTRELYSSLAFKKWNYR